MAPPRPTMASRVPHVPKGRKALDIYVWKMKVELASLKLRETQLVQAIAELEQAADAGKSSEGHDLRKSDVSKTLSHEQVTAAGDNPGGPDQHNSVTSKTLSHEQASGITVFIDNDGSEDSRTVSNEAGVHNENHTKGTEETKMLSH